MFKKFMGQQMQTNQNLQNAVNKLDVQVGQIASSMSNRASGTFPSQTEVNPRHQEHAKVVHILRSGKQVDNKVGDANEEQEDGENMEIIQPPHGQPTASNKQSLNPSRKSTDPKIPKYAKNLKDLCTNKRRFKEHEQVALSEEVSAVLQRQLPPKLKDPGSFSIPCIVSDFKFQKALLDLGASINLMLYHVYEKLNLGELQATSVSIQLADRTIRYPKGILEDVSVKVEELILPADFLVLEIGRRAPELELKQLPKHLKYAYLGENETLPVIVASHLGPNNEKKLLRVLKEHKTAIGWSMADIKGISPTLCMHKILLEDNAMPKRDAQRRLNPNMKEVVRKEVMKLLNVGIIYPISDSKWVSPVQVVPKKSGITVVKNEANELVPIRMTMGWRVCIDYRKLNTTTSKDHFPLPFIDQMLERLAGHSHYCFLDGYSGYNQIAIAPEDQEKTTFTCPFGTFAYRRMPFGLCNALISSQLYIILYPSCL
ncbi:hypothetical protein L3X38_004369 [Prunus dulcis]|uniref:Reverse transcriptase domain-containing protein n=1 Tax=Prunus dulcis TaxID=3755 RepID=A0AAD4ZNU5_PRUDU|nr:hypothetical protein L3X38_004369 [Prunus dulcis]